MNTAQETWTLHGPTFHILETREAARLAAYLLNLGSESDSEGPEVQKDLRWAVFQGSDTLVWAVRRPDTGGWRWATEHADRGAVAAPSLGTLQELRAFGPDAELLLWRGPDGVVGRLLREEMGAITTPDYTPLVRRAAFLPVPDATTGKHTGSVLPTADPLFVRRSTGSGRTTVTPPGDGVELRGYVEACHLTGVLRIAVTRYLRVYGPIPSDDAYKEAP